MFGLFSKRKRHSEQPISLASIAVDLHSHVLPGIDDGAQTLDESVQLIQALMQTGIQKIIATPHIMADYYKNTPATIHAALDKLQQHLASINLPIEIEAAAEHYYDEYFLELVKKERLILIQNKYALFEFSFANKPLNVINTIWQMVSNGITPVLAHPERYGYLTLPEVADLKERGCLMQLNTISLTGYYGKGVKDSAEKLVAAGVIDFISSDMHHTRHAEALQKALTEPVLKQLLDSNKLINASLL
ncbi:capsular biosynthesis protein [Mucilaginibacter sp. Bleaf8]|uniref:tyrosine-protein phosphatase n=1 Tax=Mucilaginibacter sp. Bleaf8 TaxID=2834430 RepID=UPI001BCB82F2|nr:CpsB/CapC family capsule biosynthesis tyrosine phosphatase [Mucilaginibacter sp. Bleaf8]MBS7566665.1 capsular biosynthesis protein [Mucilaginibacter sp. Bleaf8]